MKAELSEAFFFIKSNLHAIIRIFAPYLIFTSLLGPFISHSSSSPDTYTIEIVYLVSVGAFYTYLMARFIKFMAFTVSGHPKEQTVSLAEWWRLVALYFVLGIAVMVGAIAFIIPGVYIAAKYGFADFESILNDKPVFSALSESWEDTTGKAGKLMMLIVLNGAVTLMLNFVIFPFEDLSLPVDMVVEFLYGLISAGIGIFTSVVFFRVYTKDRLTVNPSYEENA
jgi:hypothetical protein